jgi:tetratricopeptide (TPR) repeat protein
MRFCFLLKTFPWRWGLALTALWLSFPAAATTEKGFDAIAKEARSIQEAWTEVFYRAPRAEHVARYRALLEKVRALKAKAPDRAEPLIVEGIILCTYSAADLGLDTIDLLEASRDLLKTAISRDPKALDGAAYVTLGNLYRKLPGWPILYGDRKVAREYLATGVRLFPEGIDTNYFMGDLLLEEGQTQAALPYLEKAALAPIRPSLRTSDEKLHQEASEAFLQARNGKANRSEFYGQFTPSFR